MQKHYRPSLICYFIPIISLLTSFLVFICGLFMSTDMSNTINVQCPGNYTINILTPGKYIVFYTFNSSDNTLDKVISNAPVKLDSIEYTIYNKDTKNSVMPYLCIGNQSYTNENSSSISLISFNIETSGTYQFNTNALSNNNGSINLIICKTSTTLFILCILGFILFFIIAIVSFIIISIKRKTLVSEN